MVLPMFVDVWLTSKIYKTRCSVSNKNKMEQALCRNVAISYKNRNMDMPTNKISTVTYITQYTRVVTNVSV